MLKVFFIETNLVGGVDQVLLYLFLDIIVMRTLRYIFFSFHNFDS